VNPSRTLLLCKHGHPDILPDVPAPQWPLSDEGRAASAELATRLAVFAPVAIACSTEPKARETAQVIGTTLNLIPQASDLLCEQDNRGVPFYEHKPAFEAAVSRLFTEPDEQVFGPESGIAAAARIARWVEAAHQTQPAGALVAVSHGRAIMLWLMHVLALTPDAAFAQWQFLGLADFVAVRVVSRPGSTRLHVAAQASRTDA
jgi:broad specificity phosphatase PhoE